MVRGVLVLRDKEDYEFEMQLELAKAEQSQMDWRSPLLRFPIKEEIGEVVGHVGALSRVDFKD